LPAAHLAIRPSPHVAKVCARLERAGWSSEIRFVDYELQKALFCRPVTRFTRLFKIINHNPFAGPLEHLLHELQVQWMRLIIVLCPPAGENDVERNLIR